jgi:hypothetical protein
MEGRYLLPVIPAWGILVGCGIGALRPVWRPSATALIAVGSVAYTFLAIAVTVNRFYL